MTWVYRRVRPGETCQARRGTGGATKHTGSGWTRHHFERPYCFFLRQQTVHHPMKFRRLTAALYTDGARGFFLMLKLLV